LWRIYFGGTYIIVQSYNEMFANPINYVFLLFYNRHFIAGDAHYQFTNNNYKFRLFKKVKQPKATPPIWRWGGRVQCIVSIGGQCSKNAQVLKRLGAEPPPPPSKLLYYGGAASVIIIQRVVSLKKCLLKKVGYLLKKVS